MTIKKSSTRILMPTITALNSADSLMPQTSTIVISATIPNANKLKTIGMPKMCGALSISPGIFLAVRKSVESHCGMSMPRRLPETIESSWPN